MSARTKRARHFERLLAEFNAAAEKRRQRLHNQRMAAVRESKENPRVLRKILRALRAAPSSTRNPTAGMLVTQGQHEHTCVQPDCRAKYDCVNLCDSRSLSDSLCPACFEEAQCPL